MKKRILLLVYSVLLCCTITFAWILDGNPKPITGFMFDYSDDSKMSIASIGVDVAIGFRQGDGYVAARDFVLRPEHMMPNARIPFKIMFDHQSDDEEPTSLPISLSLVGIRVSDPILLDKMYISVTPVTDGLTATNGRSPIYKCFSDAIPVGEGDNVSYRLEIYNNLNKLYIPHNDEQEREDQWDEGNRSVLDCYLEFHSSADASYQDISLDIGIFRVE